MLKPTETLIPITKDLRYLLKEQIKYYSSLMNYKFSYDTFIRFLIDPKDFKK